MARTLYDLDVLRTFTTGVALGSFVRAADRLGRSTSAVSAQLKKLESQAGTPLLRKSGRGLVLTEAGEILLAYARRLLDLNDEAAAAVSGSPLHGLVRLGLQEDLGETLLPGVLGRFARAHPQVRIEVCAARSTELRERFAVGQLDLALLWDAGIDLSCMRAERIIRQPLHWIGPAGADTLDEAPWWQGRHALTPSSRPPLPLVLLEDPCPLRRIVTTALDHAGLPWLHAFHSSSLGAMWAATAAGLGLSVRTSFGLPAHVRPLSASACGLPELPSMELVLGRARDPLDAASERLAALLLDAVREHMGFSGKGGIVPAA